MMVDDARARIAAAAKYPELYSVPVRGNRLRGREIDLIRSYLREAELQCRVNGGAGLHAAVRYVDKALTTARSIIEPTPNTARHLPDIIAALEAKSKAWHTLIEAQDREREEHRRKREERFSRDRARSDKIELRSHLLRDAYDLADYYGIENPGRADLSNAEIRELLIACASRAPGPVAMVVRKSADDALRGAYRAAWSPLYDIILAIERGE